jgi:predicted phosphodiesterase
MKIAVIADVHANLPALEATLLAINAQACDSIYHIGDAIAIGPYPAECVDLMQNTPNLKCVKGNHELYFVNGLPKPQPEWMSDGEVQHQLWTHQQLGKQRKSIISQWPMILEEVMDGSKTIFLHYGLTSSGNDFIGILHNPSGSDMDKIFGEQKGKIVFFGHDHVASDINGKARYINPGSLGCCPTAIARYTIATYEDGNVDIQHHSVAYDDRELFKTFEKRAVPEKEFIYKAFFGGRFST